MKDSIPTREIFVLDSSEPKVRGTYHKACDDNRSEYPNTIISDRIGVVFLNSTSPTRAANGDAAVYLAEAFAQCGYPSFRLDLPGFGDSDGNHPEDLVGFICKGGFASGAAANIKELTSRFNLSRVIIVGHCAGSVSALYTAARCKECKGLVLIGPFFHLTQLLQPTKLRRQLKIWALHSRAGSALNRVFESMNNLRLSLRRGGLPKNANRPLLRCWKKLATSGLPILILRAPDRKSPTMKPAAAEFNYLQYLLRVAGRDHKVDVQLTEGANNAFSNFKGRAAVRLYTEQWLTTSFPLVQRQRNIVSPSSSGRDKPIGPNTLHESYLHE